MNSASTSQFLSIGASNQSLVENSEVMLQLIKASYRAWEPLYDGEGRSKLWLDNKQVGRPVKDLIEYIISSEANMGIHE